MKGDVAAAAVAAYQLYPSSLPQTTQVREDLQQLEEQKRQAQF